MFYPDSYVLMCFEIVLVYLRLAACRVYEGHLQKGMNDKTCPETSKK